MPVLALGPEHRYDRVERSLSFPGLPPKLVAEFVVQAREIGDVALRRSFRLRLQGLIAAE